MDKIEDSDLHALYYGNELLVRIRLGSCYCKKQIGISSRCVNSITTLSKFTVEPLACDTATQPL